MLPRIARGAMPLRVRVERPLRRTVRSSLGACDDTLCFLQHAHQFPEMPINRLRCRNNGVLEEIELRRLRRLVAWPRCASRTNEALLANFRPSFLQEPVAFDPEEFNGRVCP
jgi:hypothetical protein